MVSMIEEVKGWFCIIANMAVRIGITFMIFIVSSKSVDLQNRCFFSGTLKK